MEKYAKFVLLLMYPYRCNDDIKSKHHSQWPYVHKLREIHLQDLVNQQNGKPPKLLTSDNIRFLENIQNSAYNSLRYKPKGDPLENSTIPFDGNVTVKHPLDVKEDHNEIFFV